MGPKSLLANMPPPTRSISCLDELADMDQKVEPALFGATDDWNQMISEHISDDDRSDDSDIIDDDGSKETLDYADVSAKESSSDRLEEIGKKERPVDLEEMTTRQLRELCKEKGIKVRGIKSDILKRLKSPPEHAGAEHSSSEGGTESEDGSFNADPELDTSSSSDGSVVALTAEALERFQSHLLTGDRPVNMPVRYTPSNSVVDDDDSDSRGISVDSDMDVCELSSDSSTARSIVHAIQKRRRL